MKFITGFFIGGIFYSYIMLGVFNYVQNTRKSW